VELNGFIYVIGGWDGQEIVKTVEKYNTVTKEWTKVSHFQHMRMKSGVAALDGKIYVVGGCLQTYETCYNSDVYDPEKNSWTQLPEPRHARSNPLLIPHKGKLYLFGGDGNSQGVVEVYDPHTRTWNKLNTFIKSFINGGYAGCLIDKPWDWDMNIQKELTARNNIRKMLSGVGLDVVQTMSNYYN
jgi:N-acetylneuraminic acid mutarotase